MKFLLLWLLATLDSACIGYREAAGRSALIDKRAYFRRALIRGALFGQLAVGVAGVAGVGVLLATRTPRTLLADLDLMATRMLLIYLPYAVVLLIAFLARLYPSVDIRSITSTVIFGPFTLIRPLVVLAGALSAVWLTRNPLAIVLLLLVVIMMLTLETALGKLRQVGLIS